MIDFLNGLINRYKCTQFSLTVLNLLALRCSLQFSFNYSSLCTFVVIRLSAGDWVVIDVRRKFDTNLNCTMHFAFLSFENHKFLPPSPDNSHPAIFYLNLFLQFLPLLRSFLYRNKTVFFNSSCVIPTRRKATMGVVCRHKWMSLGRNKDYEPKGNIKHNE